MISRNLVVNLQPFKNVALTHKTLGNKKSHKLKALSVYGRNKRDGVQRNIVGWIKWGMTIWLDNHMIIASLEYILTILFHCDFGWAACLGSTQNVTFYRDQVWSSGTDGRNFITAQSDDIKYGATYVQQWLQRKQDYRKSHKNILQRGCIKQQHKP